MQSLSDDDRAALASAGPERQRRLNHLLFPGPATDFDVAVATYGDISVVDTFHYLYGLTVGSGEEVTVRLDEGKELLVSLEALGEPDDHGERTAMFNYNGSLRPVQIRDEVASVGIVEREKADAGAPGSIGSPFSGMVTPTVAVGDAVAAGQTVATIEAMKMESSITSPVAGTVALLAIDGAAPLNGGDLILVVE
ncbi:hypothetical protein GCM10025876_38120 [Demequina litorisediminis]|uniref:Lipoyl-binding domain-containing protein n=1 Tax=Demequina litorisediminis TaxID=1849022 RepID=A0ABQ6ILQ1_9MICO|nr:hypothetical protein GCM10025876_38120 [Demequina litorisediminis]